MSLRSASIQAYRDLYRAASYVADHCPLHNRTGLQAYIGQRFGELSTHHRRRLTSVLQEQQASSSKQNTKRTDQIVQQYEAFISHQIDLARELSEALPQAVGNPALTSVLQVIAAGIGNAPYQRKMEASFRQLVEFDELRAARQETTEEEVSAQQNRIMQHALMPYAERLLLLHRTAIGSPSPNQDSKTPLLYLSPWQVTESIVGTRNGVTAHHLQFGRDHVVLEIDEVYNKQIVYICCPVEDGSDASYDWAEEVERVETSESEEVQKTTFHSTFLLRGTRLCDTLQRESPMHAARRTVIVGHGAGGAVALVMGLLLHQRGFDVSNVVSFGAPKAILGTLDRFVAAINPIRVVIDGDPLVEFPVTGTEGAPFIHVGEILLLSPASPSVEGSEGASPDAEDANEPHSADLEDILFPGETSPAGESSEGSLDAAAGEDDDDSVMEKRRAETERQYLGTCMMEHYAHHIADPNVGLTYAEGEEVWDDGDYTSSVRDGAKVPYL